MFTHKHEDHFSKERLVALLKARAVKKIILPPACLSDGLCDHIRSRNIDLSVITKEEDGKKISLGGEMCVTPYRSGHTGSQYAGVSNISYLVSFGSKKVLVTGDVDFRTESYSFITDELDAVFVNPLFFHAIRRGIFFKGNIPTKLFCIYHVPTKEYDPFCMLPQMKKDYEAWIQNGKRAIIMDVPGEKNLL